MRIVIIGFQNSGKTSVGRLLAKQLNKPFIDIDASISEEFKMSVRALYRLKGEQYFRDAERKIIEKLPMDKSIVIATGGGSLVDVNNVVMLKRESIIIYLQTSIATLKARYCDDKNLPIFFDHIDQLYNTRKSIYKNAADIQIITDNKTQHEIVDDIKLNLMQRRGVGHG